VFIIAALSKGIDPVRWGRQIEILLGSWGNAVSTLWITAAFLAGCIVLLVEFLLGAMLIIRYRLRFACVSSIILLCFFAIVIIWEWLSGQSESCGCFGALIERTPLTALIEDTFFIILAVIAYLGSGIHSGVKIRTFGIIATTCLIWIIFFSIFPLKTAVIRSGSRWNLSSAKINLFDQQASLVWVFDPECSECIAGTERINKIASDKSLPRLCGITEATAGRLQEFLIDFEPAFPVIRISKDDYKHIFLPAGSLILIDNNSRIVKIWRPKLLPPDTEEIVSLIQKRS
jgi:hypothetical protein